MFDKKKENIDEGLEYFTELMVRYSDNNKVQKKLHKLCNYLTDNYDGLFTYKLRNISLTKPSEEIIYRNMETMKSSIYNVMKLRMKSRKMGWTKDGANSLEKLSVFRDSVNFYDILDVLFDNMVSEDTLVGFCFVRQTYPSYLV